MHPRIASARREALAIIEAVRPLAVFKGEDGCFTFNHAETADEKHLLITVSAITCVIEYVVSQVQDLAEMVAKIPVPPRECGDHDVQ